MSRTIIPITHCTPYEMSREFTGDAVKALTQLKNVGNYFVLNNLENLAYITKKDCTIFYIPNIKLNPYSNQCL